LKDGGVLNILIFEKTEEYSTPFGFELQTISQMSSKNPLHHSAEFVFKLWRFFSIYTTDKARLSSEN
jgi:hypothetical protein